MSSIVSYWIFIIGSIIVLNGVCYVSYMKDKYNPRYIAAGAVMSVGFIIMGIVFTIGKVLGA